MQNFDEAENLFNQVRSNFLSSKVRIDVESIHTWLNGFNSKITAEYLPKWEELALTDRESVLDCCLEILGDALFSRFFTNRNGFIVCNSNNIAIAYGVVSAYMCAKQMCIQSAPDSMQKLIMSDIKFHALDDDVLEELEAVYAFSKYLDLFEETNKPALGIQVERLYKKFLKDEPIDIRWRGQNDALKFDKDLIYFYTNNANNGNVGNYIFDTTDAITDIFTGILQKYFNDDILFNPNAVNGCIYIGADSNLMNRYLRDMLANSPMYFTGFYKPVIERLKSQDIVNLFKEIDEATSVMVGEALLAIRESASKVKIKYIDCRTLCFTADEAAVKALPEDIRKRCKHIAKPNYKTYLKLS